MSHFNSLDEKHIFYPVIAACTSIKSIFRLTLGSPQEPYIMILGKQSIAGLALALFVATTLPAQAGAGILHGKKKQDDDLSTSRKPTAAQNALIDKAIAREKVVVKTVKERAPLVETYIQNMKPDPAPGPGSRVRPALPRPRRLQQGHR